MFTWSGMATDPPFIKGRPTMRFKKASITAALVAVVALGGVAYACGIDGQGNIRCGDGSSATVAQQSDGTWTVTAAGKNGSSGGSFPRRAKPPHMLVASNF
jgi:hypothetical protein